MAEFTIKHPPTADEIAELFSKLSASDIVVVPDSEDERFDALKLSLVEIEHVGRDPVSGRQIWRGAKCQQPSCPALSDPLALPTIVCFFTEGTRYAELAERLESSCLRLDLPHAIEGVQNFGSWEANCAFKPQFILRKWLECQTPILWVDADAIIRRSPTLLASITADFAVQKVDRWQFNSATVFLNQTENARRLLENWIQHCQQAPATWDQEHLDSAWEETAHSFPLHTLWLPQSYARIFDRAALPGEDPEPVIEQFQASRELKPTISSKPPTPPRQFSEEFLAARRASRSFHHNNSSQHASTRDLDVNEVLTICYSGRTLVVGGSSEPAVTALLARGVSAQGIDTDHGSSTAALTLPFENEAFENIVGVDYLEHVAEKDITCALSELYRVTRRVAFLRIMTTAGGDRNRAWWETRFFEAGFRKHPLNQVVNPYESLVHEGSSITLVLEKIPLAALAQYPLASLKAERDLHMDMLRESGPRSDAHIARYQIVSQYVKDGDVILDAACGLGYGSALLASQFPGCRVVGLDNSEYAIAYARANYAAVLPNVEFHKSDVCDLTTLGDRQIDVLSSFETIEHIADPDRFLDEVARRLSPQGIVIASVPNLWVDETGKDPNPYHLHTFDFARFRDLLNRHFSLQDVYRQNAEHGVKGDHGRIFRKISSRVPAADDTNHTEWWVLVGRAGRAATGASDPLHGNGADNHQPLTVSTSARQPFSAIELNVWLDEYLTVCGERRALIAGPGATEIVGKLLRRGIDAWGVDTSANALTVTHGGRCHAGTLGQMPLEKGPFHSALLLGALDDLEDGMVRVVLNQLRTALTGSLHARIFRKKAAHRNRVWWETNFFEAGFRKHPIRYYVQPFDCLKYEQPLVLYFDRLTENGETFDKDTSKSGPSITDPTRIAERTADAIMARYELAAPLVRPWDTVLDLGCGCGHGTHLLQRATRGSRFIGVDADERAIAYARAHFATSTSEFRCQAPAERLLELPEASIDFGILALPLSNVGALAVWWDDLNHILTPGGRFVFALSGHCSPWEMRHHPIGKDFLLESVYRQSGNEGAPTLQKVSADDVTSAPTDTWILVVMKDPLIVAVPPYRETFFRNVADGSHADVLRYPDFYANPWILHSLVHGGIRMSSPEVLGEAAGRLLQTSDANSADAGAALCILLYRAMEGTLSTDIDRADLIVRTERYLGLSSPNPHQLRWQVSLAFALGQLALQNGDFDRARRRFAAVADFDVFRWGPSLATKTTKALFLAGWLAWCADDLDEARRLWKRGIDFGRTLLARPLDETLMNPEFPNLFCYGDGTRELIQSIENIACCANGLHALGLRDQGISCRWDHIVNSFQWQLENVGHSRDATRFNLHHPAEKEPTPSNTDAIQLTTAANNPLMGTITASANAIPEEAKGFLAVANEYFERGDLQSCRGSLGWALDVAPDNADILTALGGVLFQLGDLPGARTKLESALTARPDEPQLLTQLALTCLKLGDIVAFKYALGKARALGDRHVEPLHLLAKLSLQLPKVNSAPQAKIGRGSRQDEPRTSSENYQPLEPVTEKS